MLNVLAVVLSCCGDGGTVTPGPWVPGGSGGGSGSCSSCTSATHLASTPTACSANHYATSIDTFANLTCSTVSDTGLANAYSGVGSCGSHQFVTVEARNAAPTCAQPAFSDISGTATDSQLASSYSGVGACSTHQWVSTETRNAAPTCSQPNYTDLAGCSPGAGGGSDMQYNNAGCIGGVANVTSDGTHEIYVGESTVPSAPSGSGSMAFDYGPMLLSQPMRKDFFFGIPMPLFGLRATTLAQIGSAANWQACVNYPSSWQQTSFDIDVGCTSSVVSAENDNVAGGGGWSTSFTGRMRRVIWGRTSGQTWAGMHRGNLDDGEWTGNAAGVGGFIFMTRFWGDTHNSNDMTFVGVAATASAFPNGSKPSQQVNTAYVGCDSTDTNLQVCSNDGSTTSCTTTNSSFPCRTNSTIYDVTIAYPPNGALPDAGTGFAYFIERLDSAATINGTKNANLPSNSVQMTPHVVFGSPDGGTLAVKIGVSYVGTLANW